MDCLQRFGCLLLRLHRADVLVGSQRGKMALLVSPPKLLDDFVVRTRLSFLNVVFAEIDAQLARLRSKQTNDVGRRKSHT